MKTNLLLVDYQNCFTQPATLSGKPNPLAGSLFVPNSDADIDRIINFIVKNMHAINSIALTGDFHPTHMISFPNWWINDKGEQPALFTVITVEDVETGVWKASNPEMQEWSLYYVRQLAENNKTKKNNFFDLRIWPYHAIAGTTGCNFEPDLLSVLEPYMESHVTVVMKGTNGKTEQQGAYEADVPVLEDPETKCNSAMSKWLDDAFEGGGDILIAGEAQDICLAYTVYSILSYIPSTLHNRIVLLEDCMSPIYPELGETFFNDMRHNYNVRICKSTGYFA